MNKIEQKQQFLSKYNRYVIVIIRTSMNKSIMKTRNELQRITQKINQLKNKYSCQNLQEFPNDIYNRPMPITPSNNRKSITQESLKNVLPQINIVNRQNVVQSNLNEHNNFQAVYRKQFKVFRNEVYQYLEHQLSRVKSRENQLQAQLQEISEQLQENKSQKQQSSQDRNRIKRIQQEISDLVELTQGLSYHQKKGESEIQKRFKRVYQRILEVEENQKKQIEKILPAVKHDLFIQFSKHLQQGQAQTQNILKCISEKLRCLQQNHQNTDKVIRKIEGQCQKLRNQVVELRVFNEKNDQLLQEAIRQTQRNKIQTLKQVKQIELRLNQKQVFSVNFSNIIRDLQLKLNEKQNLITKSISTLLRAQLQSITQKTDDKYQILEQQIKFTRQSVFQDIQFRFNENEMKLNTIKCQLQQTVKSSRNIDKPNEYSLQFNQDICSQIKTINQSYYKLIQQFKTTNQKNQSFENVLLQLQQTHKSQSQSIRSNAKAFQKLSKEFYPIKVSSVANKIEELQEKYKQMEQTSLKRPQLSKVLTIIQTFNLKMEQIQQKCQKNEQHVNSFRSQLIKAQQYLKNRQIHSNFQQKGQIQSIISELIRQQVIKNDQKFAILNQNIIQSAQQFKQYIEQSQQCYNQIQSTIKILSDNLHQITENQQSIDKTCRKLIIKSQERLTQKLQSQKKSQKPDQNKLIRQQRLLISENIVKLEKDIQNIKNVIQKQNRKDYDDQRQIKTVNEVQVQTFSIELPTDVKMFVDIIEESIKNMKSNISIQLKEQIIMIKRQQANLRSKQKQEIDLKVNNLSIAVQNMAEAHTKIQKMEQKLQSIQRSMIEVVSDLQFLLKQRKEVKHLQTQRKTQTGNNQKVLILQEQINLIKRTLIGGQGASKQDNGLKKIKKQFDQFKEKQEQQQSRLTNIVSNQVYKNMAGQFTKISQIIERTLQELQQKHIKLEYHLNCFNQRISALQNGQKINNSQAKQSIYFSTVSQKNDFQSPSKMLSTISANVIDPSSRVSQDHK